MPDNKNPPKSDQTQKPEGEEEKISRVDNIKRCDHQDCKKPALSLSRHCWEHTKSRGEYRNKIQEWTRSGKSMEKFILTDADLSNKELRGVKLSGAWLFRTNLSRSDLQGSNLSGARLWRADFSGAMLLFANLKDARLNWANLTGAKGLTKENFNANLTKEEKRNAQEFKGSYLAIRNFFSQSGLDDDASWAAFRERTLERIALYNWMKNRLIKGFLSCSWWKTSLKWFASKLMSLLTGYGERPWRVLISSGLIVICFFIFYLLSGCIVANPPEVLYWWDYLCFSIINFTTLGYAYLRPLPGIPWASFVVIAEAIIGKLVIALFIWSLSRRYVAR